MQPSFVAILVGLFGFQLLAGPLSALRLDGFVILCVLLVVRGLLMRATRQRRLEFEAAKGPEAGKQAPVSWEMR